MRPDVDSAVARSAGAPLDEADAHLLATLRRLFDAVDPPPPDLVGQVEFGLTLAAVFDEVDRLSEVPTSTAGARGAEEVRTVTFAGPEVSLLLGVSGGAAGTARLDGWVTPGGVWRVYLSCPDDPAVPLTTTSDDDGRFALTAPSGARYQVTVSRPAAGRDAAPGRAFVTPAISL